ncbi:MAG: relaxase/mobilization nuclease domain-containing protein [Beijerinckiaceae bacterium]
MKKRIIDLREADRPLLDIVSYGRGGKSLTPAQKEHIALTVRRVPEVMVKVSGGARTVAGVERHLDYIGREGKLALEADTGEHLDGKGFERQLTEDWDLDLEAHERQTERSIRGRKPPKLVHNIIFSMPPGTASDKVLEAVRKLAVNEWQLKHRYAMALHTDDDHPHVHVVVKAVSEQGRRLNIKKATLRAWRQQFASNLRELGVAANATERAVRGETKTHRSDGAYRAAQRAGSAHPQDREQRILREWSAGTLKWGDGDVKLANTRQEVVDGWRGVSARLKADGDLELGQSVDLFLAQMPPAKTKKRLLIERSRTPTLTR